jgi:hypothetical protein
LGKIFLYDIVLGCLSIQIVGGSLKYPFGRAYGRFEEWFSNVIGPLGVKFCGGSFEEGSPSEES